MIHLLPLFFRVGFFTIGGGLAAIPLFHELVISQGWMDTEQFLAVIAISESTPGSIGVNIATFVGVEEYGIWGGIIATIALVFPSYIIITSIARFLPQFTSYPVVQNGFRGVRPAVAGLIGSAAITMGMAALFPGGTLNWIASLLFVLLTFLHERFKLSPVIIIVIGATLGMLFL